MKSRFYCYLFGLLIGGAQSVAAEEEFVPIVDVPPPPPMVESVEDAEADPDEELDPEVTIIQRRDGTHEEYRLNGRLYMVKVTPKIGPPYYFVDRDGDGLMETRMNDRVSEIKVPQWVIFSW